MAVAAVLVLALRSELGGTMSAVSLSVSLCSVVAHGARIPGPVQSVLLVRS